MHVMSRPDSGLSMKTRTTLCWTVALVLGGLKCIVSSESIPQDAKIKEPLLLTPYINNSEYEEAKKASQVDLFKKYNVTAYSGFITVNSTCNNSLFFLFVVAEGNSSDTPVVLWTQGGPGLSALLGEFLQNGPVAYDLPTNSTTLRANTLQKNASIIYLDLPAGAGYSYKDTRDGYSKSLNDITIDAMEFLRQFFRLFWEYKSRPFYVAGESYAARYSVSIADSILKGRSEESIPLKGVIGGNGFLGPILDISDSTEFMYQLSMLNDTGRFEFWKRFLTLRAMAKNMSLIEFVPYMLAQTIFTNITPTFFQDWTLYNDYMSPLYTERSLSMLACLEYLNSSYIRKELHIGDAVPFQYYNMDLIYDLAPDYLKNIDSLVTNVLENTSVLLYTGQLDKLFPSVNQRNYLMSLKWAGSKEYSESKRCPWSPQTPTPYYGYAGFLRKSRNFTDALLLGMSHYGSAEKPDEMYYLMGEFIVNTSAVANEVSQNEVTVASRMNEINSV
uniref:Putative serine carboxypeptidase n=1 Tax=Rhipicephalus pulchellus TaxID=72859 RepID=L7MBD7_RHIPC